MIALINPNTSSDTTAAMLRIARREAGASVHIEGFTAPFGATMITEPAALDQAAKTVLALAPKLSSAQAVIVAAFGDPGLLALRSRLKRPVTGLAEAGMAEAAAGGRRFAVVTTTPALRDRIARTAESHGCGSFLGTWTTPGDPVALTADAGALRHALAEACHAAINGGADAIIIGGGPLAEAARELAGSLPVPLIEPLPAAVRLSLARLAKGVAL